jgi:acyl-CoA thioester hydrolase
VNDQSTAKSARILPKLENFPGRAADVIRFGDLDAQGHVNNAVFATYFETGRVVLLRQPGNELNIPGTTSVLARIDINYLRELHWPGSVDIGTGVAHIGRSSYSFAQALFRDDVCVATANATIVIIDTKTRRPQPLAEQVRARLETLRVTVD